MKWFVVSRAVVNRSSSANNTLSVTLIGVRCCCVEMFHTTQPRVTEYSKLLALLLRLLLRTKIGNDFFLLVLTMLLIIHQLGKHPMLALSSLIDSSVLGGGLL